jgi:integrase
VPADGVVFTDPLGVPLTGNHVSRRFLILAHAARLPRIRFHDLRHSAASLLLANGVPVIDVQTRLGHAKPSITLDIYGHRLAGADQQAAALAASLIDAR